ncbi:hypothetical protein EAF04_002557 [Stromatinia cepivora]|nr:hypothetical protein EAF04_002557 [Stromatinia cepivora]
MSSVIRQARTGPSTSAISSMPRSFHQFLQLPDELQIKVWEASCEHGRYVTVYRKNRILRISHDQGQGNSMYYCFKSHNPVPPIMQVSHLARVTAQGVYKLAFHTGARFPALASLGGSVNATIWINPRVDTICYLSKDALSQRSVLAAQMSALKVSRVGISDGSWYTENHISPDRWNGFSLAREENSDLPTWLTGDIKEVTLYSSNGPIAPFGALNLTSFDYATANLSTSQNQARHNQIRRFNKFMKDLEKAQAAQIRCDKLTSFRGEQRARLASCPGWLYDMCETGLWRKPELKIMMANL